MLACNMPATAQTAIHAPYSMGFELGDSIKLKDWVINDGADTTVCKERWMIGTAVRWTPAKPSIAITAAAAPIW